MTALRAAIYTRVSADKSGRGRSPEEQRQAAVAECERRGWTVVETYRDNDLSASRFAKKDRPEFARLRSDLKAKRFDVLVTWEASRATRDVAVYQQLADELRAADCLYAYSGRVLDLHNAEDEFVGGLDALLSAREAAKARERIMRAMEANKADGRVHGRVQLGYRREYDPRTGALLGQVIDDDCGDACAGWPLCTSRASAARYIFAALRSGMPAARIANELNKSDVRQKNGEPWTATRIAQQVRNRPGYLGQRVHGGKIVSEGGWPALVDPELYAEVQGILLARQRGAGHSSTAKYLLSGIASCDVCGAPMRRASQHGTEVYGCKGLPGRRQGGCVTRKLEPLDKAVETLVVHAITSGDARRRLMGLMGGRDAVEESARKLAALRARLAEAEDVAMADDAPSGAFALYAKLEAKLAPQIAALEAERIAARAEVPANVVDLLDAPDPAATWAEWDLTAKRAAVASLVEELRVVRTRGVGLHPSRVGLRLKWRGEDTWHEG